MSNKKKKYEEAEKAALEEQAKEPTTTTKVYFYIGVVAMVLAAVALGLMFVEVLGIYALISSVLLSIGALSFFATQKRKNNFKLLKVFNIVTYIILLLAIAVFVIGIIYSALIIQIIKSFAVV